MSSGKGLNISSITDKTFRNYAKKFFDKNGDGVLIGQELGNYYAQRGKHFGDVNYIYTNINDAGTVIQQPNKYINERNVDVVMENFPKKHDGATLMSAIMGDDRYTREQRKGAAIHVFNALYNKLSWDATSQEQKTVLVELKKQFDKEIVEEMDNSWWESTISSSEINDIVTQMLKMYTDNSSELGNKIYDHIDDNNFSYGDEDFKYLLNSINKENVLQVTQDVKNAKNNKNHESLLRILAEECTNTFTSQQAEKNKQLRNYVKDYFEAAGYKDTEYMTEATNLVNNLLKKGGLHASMMDGEIKKLENLMDAIVIKQPKDIANKLYQIINNESFAIGRSDTKILLDKINASNINEVMAQFQKNGNKKSLLKMIDEEWGDDKTKKVYLTKLANDKFAASKFAKNKELKDHLKISLRDENISDTELLLNSMGKNKDISYMAKTIFTQLKADDDNFNKEAVSYLLDGIDSKNVTKFLTEFNKISGGVSITSFLQNNGSDAAKERIKQITKALLDANTKVIESEEFEITTGLLRRDIDTYILNNLDNEDNIENVVDAFLPATSTTIANKIEEIADDKIGAADDVSFKLWVMKINKNNAKQVINAYKKNHGGETPINAIIEERNSDENTRQTLALHVVSSLINNVGQNRVNEGALRDFTNQLEEELFNSVYASADDLNKYMYGITEGVSRNMKTITTPSVKPLENVRPNIATLSLGEKYGDFSWQYSNVKDIKSLEDVAAFTGLSIDYLQALVESEGVRTTAYKCDAGKRTIGIGHNFNSAPTNEKNFLNNAKLSESQMMQILACDLVKAINHLQSTCKINTSKLTQGQYEALIDVAFNAPGHMKDLSAKTVAAQNASSADAAKKFDEAAYEFNQQFSNGVTILPGLCKRRIDNVLRYMGVDGLKELSPDSTAYERLVRLAINGYNNSSWYNKLNYTVQVCKMLNITESEFEALQVKGNN